jgi:hypothetical protein
VPGEAKPRSPDTTVAVTTNSRLRQTDTSGFAPNSLPCPVKATNERQQHWCRTADPP